MSRTAMIFAAGLGTRLKPLTDNQPKALVRYHGVPLLESLILKLKDSGFDRIVINVHHFADMIEDFVRSKDGFGVDVLFSDERDCLRDTGGGLRHASSLLLAGDTSSAVLVHNVDIVSNVNLRDFYEKAVSQNALASLLVSRRKSSRHLLFDETDGNCRLKGWTNVQTGEVKSPFGEISPEDFSHYAFSGVHLVSPKFLALMESMPEKFPIMDFYLSLAADYSIFGVEAPDGCTFLDVGKIGLEGLSSF